jgi:hypothetical protein
MSACHGDFVHNAHNTTHAKPPNHNPALPRDDPLIPRVLLVIVIASEQDAGD